MSPQQVVFGNVGAWAGLLTCDGTWQPMTGFSIHAGNGLWQPGKATFDFLVQFTDAAGIDNFRLDVSDLISLN